MTNTDTAQQRRAIGYVRVSTRDQADNGHSLDAQRAKIEAYATLHDLQLVEVIIDDGHSAKSLDRPGMAKLLGLIRKRAIDCVIIAKLDRITRSVRDLGDLVERFQRYGVEFASVGDNIDTTTASGRLVLNVMGSVSQWEREAIGERTADALAHMRAKGKRVSRFAPYGYRYVDDGGNDGARCVAVSEEQEAIRQIHQLRAEGLSLRKISVVLAEHGMLSRSGQPLGPGLIRNVALREVKT